MEPPAELQARAEAICPFRASHTEETPGAGLLASETSLVIQAGSPLLGHRQQQPLGVGRSSALCWLE